MFRLAIDKMGFDIKEINAGGYLAAALEL